MLLMLGEFTQPLVSVVEKGVLLITKKAKLYSILPRKGYIWKDPGGKLTGIGRFNLLVGLIFVGFGE